MDRPKIEDYEGKHIGKDYWYHEELVNDLNDYIDYLLSKGDCVSHYEKKIQELEKGLDNACYHLEMHNKHLCSIDDSFVSMTRKDWKEYLLKYD